MRKSMIIWAMLLAGMAVRAQGLPTDGPLTIRPVLQQLGERLLKGKLSAASEEKAKRIERMKY